MGEAVVIKGLLEGVGGLEGWRVGEGFIGGGFNKGLDFKHVFIGGFN